MELNYIQIIKETTENIQTHDNVLGQCRNKRGNS
jgi:hypothetical protein